ncbi:MAG: SLC13 family permease [Beijerinckiaceae bacterium]|nr:SLC13 family permease [Beijerinckiaceae bacterium]
MNQLTGEGGMLLPGIIVAATILVWASAALPEYLAALLFLAAAMVLHIAPADVVFSGFASSAFWLILSGFVFGAAIRKVGLADRVGGLLSGPLSKSWLRMVGGVVALSYALAFVMPSNMGRIALLMPIVMAIADKAEFAEKSAGRTALALAVGFGTFQLSASILPSNVPNLVMTSAAESALGLHFAYLPYLFLHGPVLGLLKGVALTVCLMLLFPATPAPAGIVEAAPPMSSGEYRLAALLLVTLVLWMTDSVHGISPAWTGLGMACVCLLPRIGFLSSEEFTAGVNFRTCLYIAGILSLAAVVARTGIGSLIGNGLLAVLPLDPARPGLDFGALVGLTSVLSFAGTANGVPALFTPLARVLSEGTGFPLATVVMTQVIGYATPLLPYQASPIVVAMGMARIPPRDGIKLCLALAAATYLVLVPLDYGWFRLLGWIP